ncbi:DNA-binding protein [Sphingopyxis sp. PAMC25046]|uniref:helix-turn-helix domain-containing protein n=1 Tax=Sphingopyxis sp. PAMC25046 TaxID=2565556 RepID=UPI00109E2963|nr:helix-turn-helix domain-containing protein [Sphingopyxis sp. PAMC25046]QCB55826.1 DNA-binding protein [Sphingopyxis sp. PAMC25046]
MADDDDEIARARGMVRGTPYLNTEQAAAYLGVSAWRMKALRKTGKGPRYRRHSRYVRYLIDDLVLWSRSTSEVAAEADRARSRGEKRDG